MLTRPARTPGSRGEHRFDQPDAGAALQAVDRERQFLRAVGLGDDDARARSHRSAGSGRGARSTGSSDRAARSSGRDRGPGWSRRPRRSRGSRSGARSRRAGRNAGRQHPLRRRSTAAPESEFSATVSGTAREGWGRGDGSMHDHASRRRMSWSSCRVNMVSSHCPASARSFGHVGRPSPSIGTPAQSCRQVPSGRSAEPSTADRVSGAPVAVGQSSPPGVDRPHRSPPRAVQPSAACAAPLQHRVVLVAHVETVVAGLAGEAVQAA